MRIKSFFKLLFFMSAFLFLLIEESFAKRTHTVFFEGKDYELSVYKIYGRQKGKTMLIIGGIQGDEPGGFLSADLYSEMSLIKGNLIVIPRANFNSIMLQRRQINTDMNRKFADREAKTYEDEVVAIIKKLISESDCLLNLHDGSGFYSPKWVNDQINPNRFGQSIIADDSILYVSKGNKTYNLEEISKRAIEKINKYIDDKKHFFHFNNHRTKHNNSSHKEQRKSATFYAFDKCKIPAFGIETSKSLPLADKVRYHNIAVNAFMEEFGIIADNPPIKLDKPDLKYVVVGINGSLPVVVENNQALYLNKGDEINISHIEANFERGLSADIVGIGAQNDYRKKFKIYKDTRVIIKKDYYPCGNIFFKITSLKNKNYVTNVQDDFKEDFILLYKVKINNEEHIFHNFDTVYITKGDKFEIVDLISNLNVSNFEVNFKGFVANKTYNNGEDRGHLIDTENDLWHRYSLDKKGKKYQIISTYSKNNKEVGKLFVEIREPKLSYAVVEIEGKKKALKNRENLLISSKVDFFSVLDFFSNFKNEEKIKIYVLNKGRRDPLKAGDKIYTKDFDNNSILVIKGGKSVLGLFPLKFY